MVGFKANFKNPILFIPLLKLVIMIINKRTSFLAIGATLIPFISIAQSKSENTRPNIIHIMTDDHSFQTISAYGHPISTLAPTPNLDRLADEGILFTRSYVENSISSPSRATLLTGLYSHKHGQTRLGKGLDPEITVLPELLQDAGYQTAIVGKWHLNNEPKGFDYFKILYDQGDYYNPEFRTKGSNNEYIKEEGYATTLITDHSLEWLENRDKNRPFCLFLHPKAPHRNWMPETKHLTLYDDIEFPYPDNLFDNYENREAAKAQEMSIEKDMSWSYDLKVDQLKSQDKTVWIQKDWERALGRMTPEQKSAWDAAYNPKNEDMIASNLTGKELVKWKYQRYIRDYMRCIKSLDDQVGRVLDYLEKEGLLNNTVIVYTSDQGFYMGEHGWFDKRFMYEESFRMPLLIRYPKQIKKEGKICEKLVQNIDFAPTYLTLAGVDVPKEMVGRSLTELMDGKAPKSWRKSLYYHYYDYPAIHMVHRHDGVRTNRYKLIHFYGKKYKSDNDIDSWELFDLKKDPTEMNNIYHDKKYKSIVDELTQELYNYRKNLDVKEY